MDQGSSHRALQARVDLILGRIATLKKTINTTDGITKIEAQTRLADLEQRHKKLEDQLRKLDSQGASMWQNVRAELELMTDDLSNSVDALTAGMALLHTPRQVAASKSA